MNIKILASIVIVIVVAASLIVWQAPNIFPQPSASPTPTASPSATLPDLNLTVIGANGEQVVLNASSMAALTTCSASGGLKSSSGVISQVGTYTGVSIPTLCNLVGGITAEQTLTITASDGYSMVYTYEQANGQGFITYDPVTGSEKAATQPMTMIVYYFVNGTALSTGGPLRIGVIGSEGLLTEGHFWTKMVSKIEITNNVRDWTVTVSATGCSPLPMDRQAWTADLNHFPLNWTDNSGNIWTGTALWRWVSWYNYNGGVSNATLDQGYSVQIISGDGYNVTVSDSRVKLNDDIIVAGKLNDAVLSDPYWPLTLTGANISSQEKVKNILQIQIILANATASPTATPTANPAATPTPTPAPTTQPTATPTAPPSADYSLIVNGTSAVTMTKATFESQVTESSATYTDSGTSWVGTPLHRIVTWAQSNGVISSSLLTSGYVVKVIASDGYSAAFIDTRVYMNTNIVVANQANGTALTGNYWPLTLTGSDLSGKEKIKGVAQVQIVPIPHCNLTLVAANGTELVLYSNDIVALDSYTSIGGTKNSAGTLANLANYTGIKMSTLLDLVGGITSSNQVKISSTDGYVTTYTYEQINAQGIGTYDSTGTAVPTTQPLTMIIAYLFNGESLISNSGPMRAAYVSSEGLYSTGSLWAKMVWKIEILNP